MEGLGYKTQMLLRSSVLLIFHIFNDILKVSCLGSLREIVQDVERSEKALPCSLKNSAFIHLLGKAAVMHIKPVYTQTLCIENKLCGFFLFVCLFFSKSAESFASNIENLIAFNYLSVFLY